MTCNEGRHPLRRRRVRNVCASDAEEGRGGNDLLAMGLAQRVLQLVERVHAVGWIHCDIKPQHFMRFAGGTLKLVDYGAAYRTGAQPRGAPIAAPN